MGSNSDCRGGKGDSLRGLGLNPSNDGKLVRIPIPPLTEERRKQLAKQVHDIAEDHRTAIRNVRRDGNDRLKKMLKDKLISEDAERDALEEIQKLTDTLHHQDRRSDEDQRTRNHERVEPQRGTKSTKG